MNNESLQGDDFSNGDNDIEVAGETVDELTRIHQEVVRGNDSDGDLGACGKFGTARRVMELLASMQPDVTAGTIDRRLEDDTHADEHKKASRTGPAKADVPQTIGRFEVRELLGVGGFGMVFRAHDARLERDVALKVPTANSLLNLEARHRFERECRVVASLSHPNIVPVFEVGNDGPVTYLASELIEGKDLLSWVHAHGVPNANDSAQAMVRISEAIQHAHSRGVIHRDLKPANILLAKSNAAGSSEFNPESIAITDFGLAKFCDEDVSLTQAGSILGTPAYAAPEQLRGEVNSTGNELSDVYSLGAVFYFLLTGEAPFVADSVLGLIKKVQEEDPQHPEQISNAVPRDVAAICIKAMDKNPLKRYQSAWEFRCDVERFLNCEPTVARPVTAAQKFGKWCRRNPVVTLLSAMFVVAMLSGFSTTYYQWRVAKENLRQVTRQKLRSDLLLQKTEDSIDAMLNSTSEALRNIPSMTDVRRKMLEDALAIQLSILEEENSSDFALLETVESLRRVARIQKELGQFEEAKTSTMSAIDLIGKVESQTDGLLVDQSALYRALVDLELRLGNVAEANMAADQMTMYADRVEVDGLDANSLARFNLATAKSWNISGELKEKNGDLDAAEICFERAVSTGEQLSSVSTEAAHGNECKVVLMSAWNSLGIIRKSTGKLNESNAAFAASLRINSSLIKNNPSNRMLLERFATTTHNLANLLSQQKQFREAGVRYQKAFETFKELSIKYPSVHKYQECLPATLSGLSLIHKKAGDLHKARATTEQSIDVLLQSEKRFGATERTMSAIAFSKRALASIDSQLKNDEVAEKSFQQAESATRQLVEAWPMNPKYHYELSLTIGNEAGSLVSRKQFGLAIERLGESILEGEKAIELAPSHTRYRDSLKFVRGKLVEAMVGDGRSEAVMDLVDNLEIADSSAESLLSLAHSMANGLSHLNQQESAIEDRVFSLLESAIAAGLPSSVIGEKSFKAIADDERFGLLLNSGN